MESESCHVCGAVLHGRQRRFCSRICKNRDTNNRHQTYSSQQERGLARKLELVEVCGGKCSRCGYARNMAALSWHHLDPELKAFNLDVRSLSNRNRDAIDAELRKCILLCANCHAEAHFPELDMSSVQRLRKKSDHSSGFDIE
ncbi:hypothetical protein H9L17_08995 [Thermomonas brevis]|jgi:hypothetical protein|uniref:HNH endonuclease n=1 Tax=Thermomonas brevis TaxID=215691 RepID=A0A7G9QPU5_9GAMM|nr:hypothetical protein [Thermomonas brevis]QNN45370.1 hypothetical protein H9L17_08995 [Thermomonas brevis]